MQQSRWEFVQRTPSRQNCNMTGVAVELGILFPMTQEFVRQAQGNIVT